MTRPRLAKFAFALSILSALLWLQSLIVSVAYRGTWASVGVGSGLINPNVYHANKITPGWGIVWPRELGRTFHWQTWWPAFPLTWHKGAIILSVNIPLWIPTLAFALTGVALRKSSTRHKPGACKRCHYDLTGNTSSVCPECGAQLEPDPVTSASQKSSGARPASPPLPGRVAGSRRGI